MTRKTSILIALITVFALMGSCSKAEDNPQDTPKPPVTQDKEDGKEEDNKPEPLPVPTIEVLSTAFGNKAVSGQELEVKGTGFNNQKNGNIVLFDDIACTDILEFSETSLTVRIPSLLGKESVQISVSTAGGTSNAITLPVDVRRCDSVEVFKGATFEVLRPGVSWTSVMTTWKEQPRAINIVSISPDEVKNLHFTYPSGMRTTSSQCLAADALVGINGQYFDNSAGGTGLARDFLKIDGVVATPGANNRNLISASGAFVFSDTMADIKKVNKNEGARELTDPNVMVCGPLLIIDGQYEAMNLNSSHNTDTHPRTGVAITESGHILFVTIDGRFPEKAVGMPTPMMQEFFTLLGAKSALNLDGGGSTTMYIKGKGVVNHGCDGTWDVPKERSVNSIIYLK